uniref:Uncharacterized protein n=1 Tax=Leersia perrieri TaxID=77586 RepID=A0A0D9WXF9_9ORYZ
MSTSLAEASHRGHIKEVAALDPPTSKRRRSPIGLPIARSPGVRRMISNAIMERSQVAFQERASNTESPRYRSLSPMSGPMSSPSAVPTQLDAENQTRESITNRCRLGKRKLKSVIWKEYEPLYSNGKLTHGKSIPCNKLITANRLADPYATINYFADGADGLNASGPVQTYNPV